MNRAATDPLALTQKYFAMTGRPSMSGGTLTIAGGYDIFTFTSPGTLTVTIPGLVDYVVIAGGGTGGTGNIFGNAWGGGGGAGGYLAGTNTNLSASTYPVTVGAAAANSTWNGLTATAGGAGGTNGNPNVNGSPGSPGGSGGGGGSAAPGGPPYTGGAGGSGTPGQGNNGGAGSNYNGPLGGGGGGGAGGAGAVATQGAGTANTIEGTSITYSIGGGGQTNAVSTTAGSGGRGIRFANNFTGTRTGMAGLVVVRKISQYA